MAKPSGKQLTIDGILACGYEETFRSNKYRTFSKLACGTKVPENGVTWMVGKSGALRLTRGPLSASQSFTGGARHKAFQYVGKTAPRLNPVPGRLSAS